MFFVFLGRLSIVCVGSAGGGDELDPASLAAIESGCHPAGGDPASLAASLAASLGGDPASLATAAAS